MLHFRCNHGLSHTTSIHNTDASITEKSKCAILLDSAYSYPDVRVENVSLSISKLLWQHISTDDADRQYLSPFCWMWSLLAELGRSGPHELWLQNVAARSVVLEKPVVEHQRIIAGLEVQRHHLQPKFKVYTYTFLEESCTGFSEEMGLQPMVNHFSTWRLHVA